MRFTMPRRRLSLLPLVALAMLGACSRHRVAVVPPPVVRTVAVAEPPAPPPPPRHSPINSNLSTAATVWHLRAALNVAALACRGTNESQIIAGYNALLKSQKDGFATAQTSLQAEFKTGGGDWQDRFDDSMTRLYNFFSQAQARDAFCAAAAGVLAEGANLQPAQLTTFAAERLPLLDAPFAAMLPPAAPPVVIASANVPQRAFSVVPVPPRAVVAVSAAPATTLGRIGPAPIQSLARPAPAQPRLSLNLSTLPAN
jgi:hypothetical protein